jgi:hypothetical protein
METQLVGVGPRGARHDRSPGLVIELVAIQLIGCHFLIESNPPSYSGETTGLRASQQPRPILGNATLMQLSMIGMRKEPFREKRIFQIK